MDQGLGLQPKARRAWALRDKAMSGDLRLVCTPAALSSPAPSGAWSRRVLITLETAAGQVHEWCNAVFAGALSASDSSAAGAASLDSADLTLTNGRGQATISGNAGPWLAGEVNTLTAASLEIMGRSTAPAASVETFTA
jgi:hypothetical protein